MTKPFDWFNFKEEKRSLNHLRKAANLFEKTKPKHKRVYHPKPTFNESKRVKKELDDNLNNWLDKQSEHSKRMWKGL